MISPGPVNTNTNPSPLFADCIIDSLAPLDLHRHGFVERHHVVGVDNDLLALGQGHAVEGAVTREHHLAFALGSQQETALAADEVLKSAPLCVELDTLFGIQERALLYEEGPPGLHGAYGQIAWERSREIDPTTLWASGHARDE